MKEQVLIVNSNSETLKSAVDFFELKGIDVRRAADAETALYIVTIIQPPVILIDMILPRMDSITFAKILKNDADTSKIIILALIDVNGNAQQKKMMINICDGYISKPIDNEIFYRKITKYLHSKC